MGFLKKVGTIMYEIGAPDLHEFSVDAALSGWIARGNCVYLECVRYRGPRQSSSCNRPTGRQAVFRHELGRDAWSDNVRFLYQWDHFCPFANILRDFFYTQSSSSRASGCRFRRRPRLLRRMVGFSFPVHSIVERAKNPAGRAFPAVEIDRSAQQTRGSAFFRVRYKTGIVCRHPFTHSNPILTSHPVPEWHWHRHRSTLGLRTAELWSSVRLPSRSVFDEETEGGPLLLFNCD